MTITEKACSTCKQVLSLSCFERRGKGLGRSQCHTCYAAAKHAQYLRNKQRYNTSQQKKDYVLKNSNRILAYHKEWRRARYAKDPVFRMLRLMRGRFYNFVKAPKDKSSFEYIGCSPQHLKLWLQFQFRPGMTWSNLGSYWHIDHIIPVSRFQICEMHIAFHWTNVQPLTAEDNMKKSSKLVPTMFFSTIIVVHRFVQHFRLDRSGYQAVNESLQWLKQHLRYGDNPQHDMSKLLALK